MSKVVAFVNQKGGVGKSVLADELCFEFDRLGLDYKLNNVDPQGGLIHEASEDSNADYVVVDTPGRLDEDITYVISKSDIIIVPTRASIKDMEPLQRTLNVVKANKKKKASVIIVLNAWNTYTTYSQFEEWLRNEYPNFDKILTLPQAECLSQAECFGKSVIDYRSKAKISEQLKKLWTVVEYELGIKL